MDCDGKDKSISDEVSRKGKGRTMEGLDLELYESLKGNFLQNSTSQLLKILC